jgi:cytochrome oxidase Cu insertion factor (SCO1/SenC/PrrC family)
MKRNCLVGLVLLAILAVACGGENGTDGTPASQRAPDFTVETFDGTTFSLGEHSGTPVVLNFWESW